MNSRSKDGFAHLIPHQGLMCLIDEVQCWDATEIVCLSDSHRSADNPLTLDGRLSSANLAEYGAQAMAIHGGLIAEQAGSVAPPGYLASLRGFTFNVDAVDRVTGSLIVTAKQKVANANGWLYEFTIQAGAEELARGRATVIPQPANS